MNNPKSQKYIDTKKTFTDAIKPVVLNNVNGAIGVNVHTFIQGSVIAKYDIIMNTSVVVSASDVQKSLASAVSTGNFTGLTVNKTYAVTVKGLLIFIHYLITIITIVTFRRS